MSVYGPGNNIIYTNMICLNSHMHVECDQTIKEQRATWKSI